MNEHEMNLDELATRGDLRDLATATRRDLRDALANHPTHAQLDASLRQVMLHVDGSIAQHTNAVLEAVRDMVRGVDDQYRDLPRV
jgi:hypothetical protein